jgi:hypothetical protein
MISGLVIREETSTQLLDGPSLSGPLSFKIVSGFNGRRCLLLTSASVLTVTLFF